MDTRCTVAQAWCSAVRVAAILQARRQFELFYAVVQVLVSRGLVKPFHLKVAKKRRGRLRFAYGLLGLVEVLREAWPTVAHKTGLTESELTQAEALGEQPGHCASRRAH